MLAHSHKQPGVQNNLNANHNATWFASGGGPERLWERNQWVTGHVRGFMRGRATHVQRTAQQRDLGSRGQRGNILMQRAWQEQHPGAQAGTDPAYSVHPNHPNPMLNPRHPLYKELRKKPIKVSLALSKSSPVRVIPPQLSAHVEEYLQGQRSRPSPRGVPHEVMMMARVREQLTARAMEALANIDRKVGFMKDAQNRIAREQRQSQLGYSPSLQQLHQERHANRLLMEKGYQDSRAAEVFDVNEFERRLLQNRSGNLS